MGTTDPGGTEGGTNSEVSTKVTTGRRSKSRRQELHPQRFRGIGREGEESPDIGGNERNRSIGTGVGLQHSTQNGRKGGRRRQF